MSMSAPTQACIQSQLTYEQQQHLKEYLDTFHADIHNIRLRMQLHLEIADAVKSGALLNQQFWGFFQGNVNVSLIVAGMFSIFEDGKDRNLKKFVRFMRTMNIYLITDEEIAGWIKRLQPHEGYRNCFIAHSSLKKPFVPPVDYKIFIEMLDQLASKLEILKQLITDHRLLTNVWHVPTVDPENPVLLDLRKLLLCSES